MNRLRDAAFSVLSRDWAGLVIAALAAALCWAIAQALPDAARSALTVFGLALGSVLALASLRHLLTLTRARRAQPAPGKMINLGGYRVHLLAEGESRPGRPPVLWFAGGHASGYAIHHLHLALRSETRSILIDRPGTGWSDTGPFPRTTAREAEEMIAAIEKCGEHGPFVWAGHSFGGLLVANVARRRPDLVHTVVLLDPTPLETIVFGPPPVGHRRHAPHGLAGWLCPTLRHQPDGAPRGEIAPEPDLRQGVGRREGRARPRGGSSAHRGGQRRQLLHPSLDLPRADRKSVV